MDTFLALLYLHEPIFELIPTPPLNGGAKKRYSLSRWQALREIPDVFCARIADFDLCEHLVGYSK